jgi:hypothetical protein
MGSEKLTNKSLRFQIKCIENTIRIGEEMGKDMSWEREIVEEHKKYLPGGPKHYLLTKDPRQGDLGGGGTRQKARR